ncbi:MAG: hypothetical protein ACRDJY_10945 [Thermoleophilaceae bacterium]
MKGLLLAGIGLTPAQLLRQWWGGLEARRGTHFLTEPTGSNTHSTGELHQLLNQWQNALEAWRGTHFLVEPPAPLTIGSLPTKTGAFGLSPKRADVTVGDRFAYEIEWTVPRPNNWHDLRTIDLRVCGKGGVLWVRWTKLKNTLSLLNPSTGKVVARQVRPGALAPTRRRRLVWEDERPATIAALAGRCVSHRCDSQ